MIAIIDYDAGNINSVIKAFEYLGEECVLTRDRETILNADKAVLPGVGCFKDAMTNLEKYDLVSVIREFVGSKKPFLGICLGLQLLFDESEESPNVSGLSVLHGKCLKFPNCGELKIPQIGWNSLSFPKKSRLFSGISGDAYVYFVHSYYLVADDDTDVAATAEYGVKFHAAVEHENVYACQFHPEKSSSVGLKILKNFADL